MNVWLVCLLFAASEAPWPQRPAPPPTKPSAAPLMSRDRSAEPAAKDKPARVAAAARPAEAVSAVPAAKAAPADKAAPAVKSTSAPKPAAPGKALTAKEKAAAVPTPSTKAEKPLAALTDGEEFTVPDDGGNAPFVLDVPLRLGDGVAADAALVSLASARLGSERLAELRTAFVVEPALVPNGANGVNTATTHAHAFVRVNVHVAKLPTQGTYHLGVRVEAGGREVVLAVRVTRSAAELEATPIFFDESSFLPWRSAAGRTLIVELDEQSRRSRLSDLKVTVKRDQGEHVGRGGEDLPDFGVALASEDAGKHSDENAAANANANANAAHADDDTAASLGHSVRLGAMKPGDHRVLRLPLEGRLSPGVVKGKLVFRAPQLKEPLTVPYEMRWRGSFALLVVTLLAGLGLGILFRRHLGDLLAREAARANARDFRRWIIQQLGSIGDPLFQSVAESAFRDVREKEKTASADALTAFVGETKTVVEGAAKAVAEALQVEKARYEELAKLDSADWSLPEELRAVVTRALVTLPAARESLAAADATRARECLDGVAAILNASGRAGARGLVGAAIAWRIDVNDGLGALQAMVPPLPPRIDELLATEREKVAAAIDALSLSPGAPFLEVLQQVHTARMPLVLFVPIAGKDLEGEARLAREKLDALSPPPLAILTTLDETMARLFRQWRQETVPATTQTPTPEHQLERFPVLVKELVATFSQALLALVPKGADPKPVRALLEASQLREAAVEVVRLSVEAPLDASAPHAEDAEDARVLSLSRPSFAPGTPPDVKSPPLNLPALLREIEVERESARSFVRRSTWLQTGIVMFVSAAVGCWIYEPDFMGTARDLVAVLFWGFSTDVSANTLIGIIPKKDG